MVTSSVVVEVCVLSVVVVAANDDNEKLAMRITETNCPSFLVKYGMVSCKFIGFSVGGVYNRELTALPT